MKTRRLVFFSLSLVCSLAMGQEACEKLSATPRTVRQMADAQLSVSKKAVVVQDSDSEPNKCFPRAKSLMVMGAPLCQMEFSNVQVPVLAAIFASTEDSSNAESAFYIMRGKKEDVAAASAYFDKNYSDATAEYLKDIKKGRVYGSLRAWKFAATRSSVGGEIVRQWTSGLRPSSEVVDIGCGSGVPISQALINAGFTVFGIDASPTLLAMFCQRFPQAHARCETIQSSTLFDRKFDGAVAVGLLFLLSESDQRRMIDKVGQVLRPGGSFLFSAPRIQCQWRDIQTGQLSLSLGEVEYRHMLNTAGMLLRNEYVDKGGNHYFDAVLAT